MWGFCLLQIKIHPFSIPSFLNQEGECLDLVSCIN